MSWNKSSQERQTSETKQRRPRVLLYVGLCVAVLAIPAILFLRSDSEQVPSDSENHKGQIREVSPAIRTNETNRTAGPEKPQTNAVRKLSRREERDLRNGRRKFVPPAHTSITYFVSHEMKLFNNQAERELAMLLTAEPGQVMLGGVEGRYGPRFRQALANSAASKIEFSDDDSEYDRELKKQVVNAKKELFDRIRNGEDGVQIFKDTYLELQNLGLYKMELEQQVVKAFKDGEISESDIELTVEAANRMLAERGVSKMKMPSIFKGKLHLLGLKDKSKKAKEASK